MKKTITIIGLLFSAAAAQATTWTKVDDSLSPYDSYPGALINSAGWVLAVRHLRGDVSGRYDWVLAVDDSQFTVMRRTTAIPTGFNAKGWFTWSSGAAINVGYDSDSVVQAVTTSDGFSTFGPSVLNDNGVLAFSASMPDGRQGVYTKSLYGGPIVTMAQTGAGLTSVSSSPGAVSINQIGIVAFIGTDTREGIFTADGSAAVTTIVHAGDPPVAGFIGGTSINDLEQVAFVAPGPPPDQQIIFIGDGRAPPTVYGFQRAVLQPIILNNSGRVAFVARPGADSNHWVLSAGNCSIPVETQMFGYPIEINRFQPPLFFGVNNAGQAAVVVNLTIRDPIRCWERPGPAIVVRCDP